MKILRGPTLCGKTDGSYIWTKFRHRAVSQNKMSPVCNLMAVNRVMALIKYAEYAKLSYCDDVRRAAATKIERDGAVCWVFGETNAGEDGETVVAFRGSDSLEDYVLSLQFARCSHAVMERAAGACRSLGDVHAGYFAHYKRIREDVRDAIADAKRDKRGAAVTFVGHSLGGVCGTFGAIDAISAGVAGSVSCYTYGAPAIGTHEFCERVAANVPDYHRVVSVHDLAPHITENLNRHVNVNVVRVGGFERPRRDMVYHHCIETYILHLKRMQYRMHAMPRTMRGGMSGCKQLPS